MENYAGVYTIQNTTSGKKYIGSARRGKAYNVGYKCTPEQVLNRQRAARISNMKRNYGAAWAVEYVRRYPDFAGDVHGK